MLDLSGVEREKLADRLKKADRQLSNYGVDSALDVAMEALEYGWETPPPRWRPVVDAGDWDEEDEDDYDDYDDDDGMDLYEDAGTIYWSGPPPGDLIEAKLNVLQRQNRLDEYLALCETAG